MFAAGLRDGLGFGHAYAATQEVESSIGDELAGVAVWCSGLMPEIYGSTPPLPRGLVRTVRATRRVWLRQTGENHRQGRTMNTVPISPEDEVAFQQLVQVMRDGQNSKDGELFAS